MKRAAVFLPGRGSYTKRTRPALADDHPWVARADELRAEYDLPPLTQLDREGNWRGEIHLRPDHVSPIIYVASMIDAAEAKRTHDVVCAGGNSLGWYTALGVAGALTFDDGFRLVQEMAQLQMEHGEGGQMLYPLIDDQWRIDPRQIARVEEAVASSNGEAFRSIELGGYAVVAGTEAGMTHLETALPFVEMGPSLFPQRLKQHGPYHTPLLAPVARKAAEQLARLDFAPPETTLIDGRGARFTPWATDPDELRAYTLGAQITTPYDFTTGVRVALREYAPDVIALPGPGNTLGSICGQILIAEGWRGIRDRAAFERAQEADDAPVWSMRR
jgi:malonyl CoA-acyl carrier protein transacylase